MGKVKVGHGIVPKNKLMILLNLSNLVKLQKNNFQRLTLIMVQNLDLLGIDEHNVDEVIELELEAA